MTTGVYAIRHIESGKLYVGSAAKSFRSRWNSHRSLLRGNRHPNKYLQNAWNKYGEGAFSFDILEVCFPSECVEKEQWWINKFDTYNCGYNACPVAGSTLGVKLSPETRAKIAAASKGRRHTEETKAKMRASQRLEDERKRSEKARAKMRAAWVRRKLGPPSIKEVIGHARAAMRLVGSKRSQEARDNMSKAQTGRVVSEACKAKIAATLRGRKRRKT